MEKYLQELSKYFMIICMAFYTYECFAVFRYFDKEERNGIYFRQDILLLLIHTIGFLTLYFKSPDILYLFLGTFELIVLFAVIVLFRTIYPRINRLTVNNMCLLMSIGFIILTRLSITKSISQFKIVIVSLIIGMIIPACIQKFTFLKRLTWVYAGIGIAALGIVLLVGSVTNGSKLSVAIAGYTFQPSEFVKILFVFFLAGILYQSKGFLSIAISAGIAGIHVIILVLSRDLGSALIFFVVYICMVFVATRNWFYLLFGAGSGVAAALVAANLFSHVQVRIQAWRNPWDDLAGTGYQITQSLFAIGTGGWFGMGLGGGKPAAIPFVETDFVFSAIGEELGILFAICLILVCVSCFIMFMNIAMRVKDKFYSLVAVGLGIIYIFQVFLTIGGGTKFIPLTGVTLPFISYGGTSILTTVIMFSIIQGLYIIRQDGDENFEEKRIGRKEKEEYTEDEEGE